MKVLVVDDEHRLAAALERGLVAEGFAVDVCHDGTEGLWMATEHRYDVIVLDIMLPGLNGYEVCRRLRQDAIWTPILMLTAKDGEYDEAEALDTGADDFLSKPFSFVVLVARLKALARRRGDHNLQPMEVGDLVVDPVSRSVRRGETSIALSPRELGLLEALMRHPGEVLSKQHLLDAVWGAEFEGDPNVVEVYMGYLRRKVDRPFDRSDLETVRGEGYRIAAPAAAAE